MPSGYTPARQKPTAKRSGTAVLMPSASKAKAALHSAPSTAQTAKIRLAAKRSANPETAKLSVPRMKPSWVALVSRPMSAAVAPQTRIRSSAALLAENHSEVPKSWAMTMMRTGFCMRELISGFAPAYRQFYKSREKAIRTTIQ
jgi:hypothetical protein